jgi:hypothetical protein
MDERAALALQARMAELCGQLNVLHAALVDAVVEALDGGLWEQWGIRSPEQWLAWQNRSLRGSGSTIGAGSAAQTGAPGDISRLR